MPFGDMTARLIIEAQAQKATQAVKGFEKTVASSMGQVEARLRVGAERTKAFNEKWEQTIALSHRLAGGMRQVGIGMTIAGGAIAGALGLAVRQFGSYEQAVANATSVTGLTGAAFADATDELGAFGLKLAQISVKTAPEIADAFYSLASSGFTVAETMAASRGILALAEGTLADMGMTTELVTSAMRAFGLQATDTDRIVNVLAAGIGSSRLNIERLSTALPYAATIAKQFGLSIEETTAALGVLVNAGMQAEMAGAGFRMMLSQSASVAGPAAEALAKFGLTADDVNMEVLGLVPVLQRLKKANIDYATAAALFGERSASIAMILRDSIPAYEAMTKAVTGTNRAAEMQGQQLDTVSGQWTAFKGDVIRLAIEMSKTLEPTIRATTNTLRGMTQTFTNMPGAVKGLTIALSALAAVGLTMGPLLIGLSGAIIALNQLVQLGVAFPGAVAGIRSGVGVLVTALGTPTAGLIGALALAVAGTMLLIKMFKDAETNWDRLKGKLWGPETAPGAGGDAEGGKQRQFEKIEELSQRIQDIEKERAQWRGIVDQSRMFGIPTSMYKRIGGREGLAAIKRRYMTLGDDLEGAYKARDQYLRWLNTGGRGAGRSGAQAPTGAPAGQSAGAAWTLAGTPSASEIGAMMARTRETSSGVVDALQALPEPLQNLAGASEAASDSLAGHSLTTSADAASESLDALTDATLKALGVPSAITDAGEKPVPPLPPATAQPIHKPGETTEEWLAVEEASRKVRDTASGALSGPSYLGGWSAPQGRSAGVPSAPVPAAAQSPEDRQAWQAAWGGARGRGAAVASPQVVRHVIELSSDGDTARALLGNRGFRDELIRLIERVNAGGPGAPRALPAY